MLRLRVWQGGCEYMCDTRGSGIVSSTNDVLEMSVVSNGVGVVCERCMCLAWVEWEASW